jgi:3-oxoacyl-[acyl-carrier protein] reductase
MDVRGKVAIVTGSATGVGAATAIQLGSMGCGVVVNYTRSEAEAKDTLAQVEKLGVPALLAQCDVSDDTAVRAMMKRTAEELGAVDILVNNAGTTHFVNHADLEGLTEEMWDRIYAVNVKGTFFCTRAAAPYMKQRGEGAILNVSSVAGVRGGGSSIAYAASKAAVVNLTMTTARVLGPEIRVNCVAPGFIDGRWLRGGIGENYEAARDRTAQGSVLKKVTTPDDIAQVIISLIAGADLVTGQTLVVDAGGAARG